MGGYHLVHDYSLFANHSIFFQHKQSGNFHDFSFICFLYLSLIPSIFTRNIHTDLLPSSIPFPATILRCFLIFSLSIACLLYAYFMAIIKFHGAFLQILVVAFAQSTKKDAVKFNVKFYSTFCKKQINPFILYSIKFILYLYQTT